MMDALLGPHSDRSRPSYSARVGGPHCLASASTSVAPSDITLA
jgi:hypothetical protein